MMKPPIYQFFRRGKSGGSFVLQVRDHNTKEAVSVLDLECYVALQSIETPFWRITIAPGAKLFLTASAAASMLAAGTIEKIEPAICMPWREAYEAQKTARWEARQLLRA